MKGYRTKRIALPGGRSIEIVYFCESAAEAGAAGADGAQADAAPAETVVESAPATDAEPGLHVCPDCEGDLVYPVAWEERGETSWRIERRCPSCEWTDAGDFDQSLVEQFDDTLNDGTEALLSTLRNFSRANMEEDVDRLIAAIATGLIQPMDF